MKKAQTVLEYVLIVAFVAIIAYIATSKIDLGDIKNYVFMRPSSSTTPGQIEIEAMTE